MVVSPKLNKTFDGTDPPPKKKPLFFCWGRVCLEALSTRIWVCLGPNQNLPEETKVNMYWGDGLKYRLITIIGSYFLDNVTQNCEKNFLVTVTVTVKKHFVTVTVIVGRSRWQRFFHHRLRVTVSPCT